MNNEHEEQTRWLINYLETRFSRVDDKVAVLSSTFDSRFSRIEDHISETSKELEDRFVALLEKQQAEIDLLSAELDVSYFLSYKIIRIPYESSTGKAVR